MILNDEKIDITGDDAFSRKMQEIYESEYITLEETLARTFDYIKELQNRIKELESKIN